MKKSFAILFLLFSSLSYGAPKLELPSSSPTLTVNNRILTRVQGKAISVRDLTQELDRSFDKDYPEYAEAPEARHQYYTNSWKAILNELIVRELILADAEEMKIEIPHSHIREEMEETFGPRILETLDEKELAFEEAWSLMRSEIAMRRMLMMRVNSRAFNEVTPADVRVAYEQFCEDTKGKEEWSYRVISVRGEDQEAAAILTAEAYVRLKSEESSLDSIEKDLKVPEELIFSLSKSMRQPRESISDMHWEGVGSLNESEFSEPLRQLSRNGDGVYRIYALEEKTSPFCPDYHEVEGELRDQLVQKAMQREQKLYIEELHTKFEVETLYDLEGSSRELFVLN